MNAVIVYNEKIILRGKFAVLPRQNDYIKADNGIYMVKDVMIDCTANNRGEAIIFIRDATIGEEIKLRYENI